ncbi:MAG: 50S ribosomal protein L4 [Myxococcota bacterium]|jgi:large subunit ribosomal protein L4
MASLDVVTIANKKSGSINLSPTVFEVPTRTDLLHAEVKRQLAKRRRGTHSTKNRAAVSGGGAKPYRQKGTGRARQGTTRAAQFAGGGVVFGPVPRSYDHALPKKVRKAALRGALSHRLAEGDVTVVDSLSVDDYKTREVVKVLDALSLGSTGALIVIDEPDEKLQRSARNIPGVTVLLVAGLNVYDVLRHKKLLLTKAAVSAIELRLGASEVAS